MIINVLCGCSDIKSSNLLEASPTNLVKSFFILNKVKSVKKDLLITIDPFIYISYLDGRDQVVNSVRQIGDYEDLKTYLDTLPADQEVTRKVLNIEEERENPPDDEPNLEEVRQKLLEFFKKENISHIYLDDSQLTIKYKNKRKLEEKEADSAELKLVQAYCQAKEIDFLNLSVLEKSNTNQEPGDGKLLLYGGMAAVVVLIVGLIALAYRSGKNSHRR